MKLYTRLFLGDPRIYAVSTDGKPQEMTRTQWNDLVYYATPRALGTLEEWEAVGLRNGCLVEFTPENNRRIV